MEHKYKGTLTRSAMLGSPLLASTFARSSRAGPEVRLVARVLPFPVGTNVPKDDDDGDELLDPTNFLGLSAATLRRLSTLDGGWVTLRVCDAQGNWHERPAQVALVGDHVATCAGRCAQFVTQGRGVLLTDRAPFNADESNGDDIAWLPPGLLFNLGLNPSEMFFGGCGASGGVRGATGPEVFVRPVSSGLDEGGSTDESVSECEGGEGGGLAARELAAGGFRSAGAAARSGGLVEVAAEVVVRRVRCARSSGHEDYSAALGDFFARPRILALGDVFAVSWPVVHELAFLFARVVMMYFYLKRATPKMSHQPPPLRARLGAPSQVAAPSVLGCAPVDLGQLHEGAPGAGGANLVYFTVAHIRGPGPGPPVSGSPRRKGPPAPAAVFVVSRRRTTLVQEGAAPSPVPDPRLLAPFAAPPEAAALRAAGLEPHGPGSDAVLGHTLACAAAAAPPLDPTVPHVGGGGAKVVACSPTAF